MVFLGLALILIGGAAIVAGLFSEPGTGGDILGIEVTVTESFFVGVAAGAAVRLGFSIRKWGTKRSMAHRKERKELTRLNEKLERVEAERREDGDTTVSDRDKI